MVPRQRPALAPRRRAITEEERRRNRMTSNRLSAQRSRMKRQQREEDLAAQASRLKLENEAMRAAAGIRQQQCRLLQQENRVRAAHARELYAVLQLRNSQLRMLGQAADLPLDVPEVSAHLTQLYGGGPPAVPPLPPEIYQMLQFQPPLERQIDQMLFQPPLSPEIDQTLFQPPDDVMDDEAS
ncbi:bZIP transcription factor 53 [Brachypodium distachyon]|uniref:BZIP domain-containing protein n=1 Tax=Brachypodium distachyon TaxID=15368 RepID=I1H689_BRADI|nr:bZIP transcription factor 53 [Brachypodium distachyon]KQK22015.1 hypothetical protein BRADI_1g64550v3 [Brachypodium distachyon]|eukprot:XP_010228714.1 bZIP transcription factor 53 [Brachypodium distachyon]